MRILSCVSSLILAACVVDLATAAGKGEPTDGAAGASKQATEASEQQIQAWIEQLGAAAYRDRESASGRLIRVGLAATEALTKGLEHPDPEVRLRCRQILDDVRRGARDRIYRSFLDSDADDEKLLLGGWKAFRDTVGDSRQARRLFVAMHREEREALEQFGDTKKLNAAFHRRMTEIQESLTRRVPGVPVAPQPVELSTAATMLLIAGQDDVSLDNVNAYYLVYQSEVNKHLTGGGSHREIVRKLLGRFVARELDGTTAYYNFNLAVRYDFPEALPPALKFLAKEGVPAQYKMYALMVVGKFGKSSHLDAVEPLMSDKTQLYSRRIRMGANTITMTTQLRDIALATSIHVRGGKLTDFGFTNARAHAYMPYYPYHLGFQSESDRQAAAKKYEDWRPERSSEKPTPPATE